jgi:MYXO-CTERM domain-containing protein
MVAAGVGEKVGITLYVISEGRYEAQGPFYNATVDDSKLVWFHVQNRSNYQELSQQLMQSNNGHTWLTEFSGPTSLVTSRSNNQYCRAGSYCPGQSLGDVYLAQCTGRATSDLCSDAAANDAANDAANGAANGAFSTNAPCAADPCAAFDDLDRALVGMHPQSTWVTRMRAVVPSRALSEGDLKIQATTSQAPVSNQHATNTYDDPSYSPCGSKGGCSVSDATASRIERGLVVGMMALVGAAFVRRRRR